MCSLFFLVSSAEDYHIGAGGQVDVAVDQTFCFLAIETRRVKNCRLKKTFRLKAEKQTMDIHCTTVEKESSGGIVNCDPRT